MPDSLRAIDRTQFQRTGFLALDDFAREEDLEEVRTLLDPLFEQFGSLSSRHAIDLAPRHGSTPRIPDINRAARLEPRLVRTRVYRRARELARRLLGYPVFCTFDHAIYKPPRNAAATPWHQDQAYAGYPRALPTVHLWIPLQVATRENGCMWFVPGSHRAGIVPHSPVDNTSHTLRAAQVDESAAVCCPVPKGGVTVHTPFTLHMTGPNTTGEPRKAWILHFARFGLVGHLHPINLLHRFQRLMLPAGRS